MVTVTRVTDDIDPGDAARHLDRDVEGTAAAHQRLLADADRLSDADVARPSLLPGWSVGHVVTHLARAADGFVRMIDAANRGEVGRMYDSAESRAADIEAGAHRPAGELVADLRRSIWRLEQAWATSTAVGWAGVGQVPAGRRPIVELPFARWREADVHHADLGVGYTPADWSEEFVRIELGVRERAWIERAGGDRDSLPPAVLELAPHERVAWLLGRREVSGAPPAGLM